MTWSGHKWNSKSRWFQTRKNKVDWPFIQCTFNIMLQERLENFNKYKENCVLGYPAVCLQPKQPNQVGSLEFQCSVYTIKYINSLNSNAIGPNVRVRSAGLMEKRDYYLFSDSSWSKGPDFTPKRFRWWFFGLWHQKF